MTSVLPKQFSELEGFVEKWALGTENQRQQARISSTTEELQKFYDAILPKAKDILNFLDEHPYGQLPESYQPLYWIALSLAEIAPHVELYDGATGVPFAFEEARLEAEHGNLVNI